MVVKWKSNEHGVTENKSGDEEVGGVRGPLSGGPGFLAAALGVGPCLLFVCFLVALEFVS